MRNDITFEDIKTISRMLAVNPRDDRHDFIKVFKGLISGQIEDIIRERGIPKSCILNVDKIPKGLDLRLLEHTFFHFKIDFIYTGRKEVPMVIFSWLDMRPYHAEIAGSMYDSRSDFFMRAVRGLEFVFPK